MKLSLLEDGVLDYKGDKITLAVSNPIPSGALPFNKISPESKSQILPKLEDHIKDCPVCSKQDKICDVALALYF